jgi:alkanesulfonate monooxygenase SsuD/methylene tetrahydromethanopterin reductase-like flavin-dependent oxidoreductase (luciferase family)
MTTTPLSVDCGATPLTIVDVAAQAAECEAAGFGGYWMNETVRSMGPVLASAAGATSRMAIGAAVYIAPLHHPLGVAMEMLDLAELSGDRFVAGIGIRAPDLIRRQTGVRIDDPVAYMRDYLRALRKAMDAAYTSRGHHRGTHVTVRVPPFVPQTTAERPPPVLLAAIGPQMVRLAAAEADGWTLHPIHVPEDTRMGVEELGVGEARAERPFTVMSYRFVWHEDWPEHLLEAVRAELAFYGLARAYATHRHRLNFSDREALAVRRALDDGDLRRAGSYVPDEVVDQIVLTGSTAEIAEQVLAEAPHVDRVCLTAPHLIVGTPAYDDLVRNVVALGPALVADVRTRQRPLPVGGP